MSSFVKFFEFENWEEFIKNGEGVINDYLISEDAAYFDGGGRESIEIKLTDNRTISGEGYRIDSITPTVNHDGKVCVILKGTANG